MSLQELHIKALEQQVSNLTRDCYYLLSLINTVDEIDWDNWEEGQRIKEDLERSVEFAKVAEQRKHPIPKPAVREQYAPEPELDQYELEKFRAAQAQRQREIAQRYPKPHRIPGSPLDSFIISDSFPIDLRNLFLR